MKTLEKHTLIYDADCPMCSAYTNAFINSKMLDNDGRIPYQQVGGSFCPGMDPERAKNEIALVNRETGEVHYGLDSMVIILANRFPLIGRIMKYRIIDRIVRGLYSFISYNRKVIMPARSEAHAGSGVGWYHPTPRFDCTPSYNLKWRLEYIAFVWIITSLVLVQYSSLLTGLIPETNFFREFLICGGQVLFQFISVRRRAKDKIMDYLGNMMTVSLYGAVLLLPALLVGAIFTGIPAIIYLGYFGVVVSLMLYEHARRMKILELGWWPSVSWFFYRIIVLGLILLI